MKEDESSRIQRCLKMVYALSNCLMIYWPFARRVGRGLLDRGLRGTSGLPRHERPGGKLGHGIDRSRFRLDGSYSVGPKLGMDPDGGPGELLLSVCGAMLGRDVKRSEDERSQLEPLVAMIMSDLDPAQRVFWKTLGVNVRIMRYAMVLGSRDLSQRMVIPNRGRATFPGVGTNSVPMRSDMKPKSPTIVREVREIEMKTLFGYCHGEKLSLRRLCQRIGRFSSTRVYSVTNIEERSRAKDRDAA
jgi:hypothetical protein